MKRLGIIRIVDAKPHTREASKCNAMQDPELVGFDSTLG
jgi:hypothetical protein